MRGIRIIHVAILCCLLAPSAYLAWSFRDIPNLGTTGDDQIYLASAKSLAEGRGYLIPNLTGEVHQTRFPVLYPFLLSLVWKVSPGFPLNLPAFLLSGWLLLPVVVWLARRTLLSLSIDAEMSWAAAAMLALNPGMVAASLTLGPDLLFLALLLGAFQVLEKSEGRSASLVAAAGVLGGLLYLVRTSALPLVVTVPLWFLLRGRFKRAACFLAGMFPFVLGWAFWARLHAAPANDPTMVFYTDYFRDFLLNFSWQSAPIVVAKNAGWLVQYCGFLTAFVPLTPLPWLAGAAAIAGAALLARRTGVTHYHLFAAGYCAMLVVWTGKPLLRYLLPAAPLLAAGFVCAAAAAAGRIAPGARRAACLALIWLLAALNAAIGLRPQYDALAAQRRDAAAEEEAYRWIRANAPANAAFLANKDGVLYLATGRHASTYQALKKDLYLENQAALTQWTEAMPVYAREHGLEYAFCGARTCPGALAESDLPRARAMLERSYRALYRQGAVTVYRLTE